ncbi:10026_t:CDS:2 [Funneliformis caledonium]|uniref:10026_t:CDS:1 n=1 Tax=Funneliformis caledonium TaxID=1117310 RepID=A0A9N9BN93_9GLOM|nr:10026_t:CDS:2 [Funneliformis caledonium]
MSSNDTLDFPSLPNPFATECDQNSTDTNSIGTSFMVKGAPPKVFFPPKMSLTKELEYKKKRPLLEHISTSVASSHKLPLIPTNSHPLNHQTTTSPITPTCFSKFHDNHELFSGGIDKRHSSTSLKADIKNIQSNGGSNKEKIKLALTKRRSMPQISINTDLNKQGQQLKNDLLKEDSDERKMVIVHEIKPSDTIAGVALFYGIEANKLWTNDSIHQRKFLYIPIDQCSIIDDEAKVIVQDDHISIKTNGLSTSDNTTRPTFSPTTPSTPFTIYERELLFCTLPEHANYVYNIHNHHHFGGCSTSSIDSSSSSISSTSSDNSNNGNKFTRAEIQQLPADQLTFFPTKRISLSPTSTNSSALNTPLTTPTLPSPLPVSHIYHHKHNISFPLPTMTQDSIQNPKLVDKLLHSIDYAGEKYWKRNFGSVKVGMGRRKSGGILNDRYDVKKDNITPPFTMFPLL